MRRMPVLAATTAAMVALVACGSDSAEPGAGSGSGDGPQAAAVERLAGADLESWGCGIGFAIGTPDQTVALVATDLTMAGAAGEAIELPHADWQVEVSLGTDLFANWCDDVMEPDEPVPAVASTHKVLSGTLTYGFDGPPGDCGPASGTLTDLVIAVDGGTVEIDRIDLANEAFGCFAG